MIDALVEELERLHLRLHVETELAEADDRTAKRLRYLALEAEDVLEKARSMLTPSSTCV